MAVINYAIIGLVVYALIGTVFAIIRAKVSQPLTSPSHEFSPACLRCICTFSSGCDTDIGCNNKTKVCGAFQITQPYWMDGGYNKIAADEPTANTELDFRNCANDLLCSINSVKGYLKFYDRDCNDDGLVNCYDYISMHYLGALSCKNNVIPQHNLDRFNKCYQEHEIFDLMTVENKADDFLPQCLHCICQFSSGCDTSIGCNKKTKVCGPFQITEPYWLDGGSPKVDTDNAGNGTDFENCANDLLCAIEAVKGYFKFYNSDCNGDGLVNCYDYIAMHYFGALSCKDKIIPEKNLNRFNKCFQEYDVFQKTKSED